MLRRLFKREEKKVERKDTRTVLVHLQYVGQKGRIAEKMSKCYLEELVDRGLIFEDYEIIAYC